jgi:tetratricopeptide (TPR) repeat protein
MKSLTAILLMLLLPCLIHGQLTRLDSLNLRLSQADDSELAEIYNQFASHYSRIDQDSSLYFAGLALEAAKKSRDVIQQGNARQQSGMAYYLRQNYDSAIAAFANASTLFESAKEWESMAAMQKFEGISHSYAGNSSRAIGCFKSSLEYYLSVQDSASVAAIRGNLGMSYRNLSNYQQAIDQLLLALEYFDRSGDRSSQANTYNHLGNIFRDWRNLEHAEEYYELAYKLSKELDSQSLQASSLNNLAIVSRESGDFDKAVSYYLASVEIKKQMGNRRGIAASYLGLGITYKSMKDYSKALEYYQKTLEINRETGERNAEGAALGNIGRLYLAMDKPKDALKFLEQSNQIALETEYIELQKNNTLGIAEAWEKIGNYPKSLEAFKLHQLLKDSIFSNEKHRQIQELEKQYESEKQLKEIELLAIENQMKAAENASKDRLLRILIIFISLMTVSIILILLQIVDKNKAFKLLVKKNIELSILQSGEKSPLRTNSLSDEKMYNLIQHLEDYLRIEKPFLKPDFQLQDCAKVLETNTKYLSQAINDTYHQGFSGLINELRIKEARIILSSNVSKSYTIEAIAQLVGFNSKSAFNAAFKRFTGVTPTFYIQNQSQFSFPD